MIDKRSASIKIDPELWKEAKHFAIDEETTISAMIEEALRMWMKEKRRKESR